MAAPSSKRVYSGSALESWFRRLDCDWERQFRPGELHAGRRLYRGGGIRAIELSPCDAIVYGRVAGTDYYAVVDWPNGRPAIRGSAGERDTSLTLAVAGLYEIEELISEEISQRALPEPKPAKSDEAANATPAEASEPTVNGANGESGTNTRDRRPARPLAIVLRWREDEVTFRAEWIDGKRRQPALGPRASTANAAEREAIIGLASGARRAGFRSDGQGRFRLEKLAELPRFLKHTLPLWRDRFTVETPHGWQLLELNPVALDIEAEARENGDSGFSLTWSGRGMGLNLDSAELPALLKRGGGLHLTQQGRLVEVPIAPAEDFAAWRELQTNGQPLPRYLLFSLFERNALRTRLAPELATWRAEVTRATALDEAALPGFLRDYQKAGVRWLSGLARAGCHALLADEMGLGKTVQVLSLLVCDPLPGAPSLIVCPASVVPVWQREAKRFFPEIQVGVLRKGVALDASGPSLWLASYTQLRRHRAALESVQFGYAVLDEAQFIKNPEAKATQACLGLKAQRRIALTGTPLENRPLDLWTLFRFLMPGLLGTRRRFEQAWAAKPDEARERLKAQIGPFILRRTKAAVLEELPAKSENELACPMTELQQAEYQRLATEGLRELGGQWHEREAQMPLLSLLTRLRQACCDPGLLPWQDCRPEQSGKLLMLADRLAEATENGHKVVVFSQFTGFLDRAAAIVAQRLPELKRFELTGTTRNRAAPVDGFQNHEGAAAIFVSLKAGGTGITLHAADYVFLLDPWWNPAVERQAIDRVHRIGQRNAVMVYRMVTPGTIEARIEALKQSKRELADELLGDENLPALTDWFESLEELIGHAVA